SALICALFPYTTLFRSAFVGEPAAHLIKRNILSYTDTVTGRQAYEEKEFLSSTDERFRPVTVYNGPDGALYFADMYRGIIQHKTDRKSTRLNSSHVKIS